MVTPIPPSICVCVCVCIIEFPPDGVGFSNARTIHGHNKLSFFKAPRGSEAKVTVQN